MKQERKKLCLSLLACSLLLCGCQTATEENLGGSGSQISASGSTMQQSSETQESSSSSESPQQYSYLPLVLIPFEGRFPLGMAESSNVGIRQVVFRDPGTFVYWMILSEKFDRTFDSIDTYMSAYCSESEAWKQLGLKETPSFTVMSKQENNGVTLYRIEQGCAVNLDSYRGSQPPFLVLEWNHHFIDATTKEYSEIQFSKMQELLGDLRSNPAPSL